MQYFNLFLIVKIYYLPFEIYSAKNQKYLVSSWCSPLKVKIRSFKRKYQQLRFGLFYIRTYLLNIILNKKKTGLPSGSSSVEESILAKTAFFWVGAGVAAHPGLPERIRSIPVRRKLSEIKIKNRNRERKRERKRQAEATNTTARKMHLDRVVFYIMWILQGQQYNGSM